MEGEMNESEIERIEMLEKWKQVHIELVHVNIHSRADDAERRLDKLEEEEDDTVSAFKDVWKSFRDAAARLDALENREPVGEKEDLIHCAAYNGQTHSIDELSAEQYSTIDRLIRNIKIEVYALGYNAGKLEGNLAERKLGREQEKADVLRFFADIGPQYRGDGRPGFMYEIEGNKHRGLK